MKRKTSPYILVGNKIVVIVFFSSILLFSEKVKYAFILKCEMHRCGYRLFFIV